MGNATSCAPSIISRSSRSGTGGVVKVLSCDGRVEVYTRPVKAAELMLDKPGHFLCNSAHLKVGQRIQGLSADDDLHQRQLYFLLPMDMLYSVLTHDEITSLTLNASKHGHTTTTSTSSTKNFTRIFPQGFTDFCMFPSPASTDHHPPHPVQRYSRQRSWTPALQTIAETPSRL